jgi:hypothetical protein
MAVGIYAAEDPNCGSAVWYKRECIYCDNKCPHCNNFEESEWHYFFGCICTLEVWQETQEWQLINKYITDPSGYVAVLFRMLKEIDTN